MNKRITVETTVDRPLAEVWECWTKPEHVTHWNAASEDWHTPTGTNDLRVGGEFHYQMEAKDKSAGFDFFGTYTEVAPHERIAATIGDGRTFEVVFTPTEGGVHIAETFELEGMNSEEMQRNGWQAILNNFKKYVESRA